MHILLGLQTAFSLWMLFDAAQRKAPSHWYFIIMMPFGELVYFFSVKINDPEFRSLQKRLFGFFKKKPSLQELEYVASASPSVYNKTRFAQALHDNGKLRESRELFEEILQANGLDKEVLYGAGICALGLGDMQGAVKHFSEIVKVDMAYWDYQAALELADLYWKMGSKDASIDLLRKIVKESYRLPHSIKLAKYLAESGNTEDARTILKKGLLELETSPLYIKKKDKEFKKQANILLNNMVSSLSNSEQT